MLRRDFGRGINEDFPPTPSGREIKCCYLGIKSGITGVYSGVLGRNGKGRGNDKERKGELG